MKLLALGSVEAAHRVALSAGRSFRLSFHQALPGSTEPLAGGDLGRVPGDQLTLVGGDLEHAPLRQRRPAPLGYGGVPSASSWAVAGPRVGLGVRAGSIAGPLHGVASGVTGKLHLTLGGAELLVDDLQGSLHRVGTKATDTLVERIVEELQEQQHRHDHRDHGPHEQRLDQGPFAFVAHGLRSSPSVPASIRSHCTPATERA